MKIILLLFIPTCLINTSNAQLKAKDVVIPHTYDFTWTMTMEMKNENLRKKNPNKKDKEDIKMELKYYMKEDAKYFGFKNEMLAQQTPDANMFMVMDADLGVTSVFMDMMGRKIIQKTALNNEAGNDRKNEDFVYKKIEGKTILGYKCDGFQAEDEMFKITFYISSDVPVSFTKVWGSDTKSLPKTFDTSWLKDYADKGAVLEMQFIDKKEKKYNSTMTCTSLKKETFSIDTTQYKPMF